MKCGGFESGNELQLGVERSSEGLTGPLRAGNPAAAPFGMAALSM